MESMKASPPKPQSAPVNYVRRAREWRLARLEEEERLLNLMRGECSKHPKPTDRARSVEEKEEILADCFCGECV